MHLPSQSHYQSALWKAASTVSHGKTPWQARHRHHPLDAERGGSKGARVATQEPARHGGTSKDGEIELQGDPPRDAAPHPLATGVQELRIAVLGTVAVVYPRAAAMVLWQRRRAIWGNSRTGVAVAAPPPREGAAISRSQRKGRGLQNTQAHPARSLAAADRRGTLADRGPLLGARGPHPVHLQGRPVGRFRQLRRQRVRHGERSHSGGPHGPVGGLGVHDGGFGKLASPDLALAHARRPALRPGRREAPPDQLAAHIANVLLLFLLLFRMTGARWPSALVAALFAVHPLHVESVAW